MAGTIMQLIHFWCTTDDFKLNCSMRSSGRVYYWMPLFLNYFFVIINIEICNKAFATFSIYCFLHYVVHRQEIIIYATIHVFSWKVVYLTTVDFFILEAKKIRANAKHRLWKEMKVVYIFLIQVSVMSIENRMYLTQMYQFFLTGTWVTTSWTTCHKTFSATILTWLGCKLRLHKSILCAFQFKGAVISIHGLTMICR